MTHILLGLLRDAVVLLAFSIPLIIVSRRHQRTSLLRGFLIGGVIVAVALTIITVTSERLVQMCFDAGNPGCQDIGSTGFRLLLQGGYIIVALAEAYLISRE